MGSFDFFQVDLCYLNIIFCSYCMSVLVHLCRILHNIYYSCHVILMLRSKQVPGRCSYIVLWAMNMGAEVPILQIFGSCRI